MSPRRRQRDRIHGATTALSLIAAAVAGTGCETIGQDLGDLAKGIFAPTPAEAARMAVDPHDPDRRREGTLMLANASFGGAPAYLTMYRDYVQNDRDPLVKAVAIRALARHGSAEDAALIAPRLRHENVQVRWEAAKGLQRLHDPGVVPDLLRTVGTVEEHSSVRVAAATALGQYAEDRVFQGLVGALDARELSVNVVAEDALRILTGRSFGLDPRPWLNWYNGAADTAFDGRLEYLYPTYQREETLLEKLAFWTSRHDEEPAPPAGLRPRSERRTYEDDEEPGGGDVAAGEEPGGAAGGVDD